MKTINNYFMCSNDAVYSLISEKMCNVIKGEVRTNSSKAIIFAVGENTSGHADHPHCHVHATHPQSIVYANVKDSHAYAHVKDSTAYATNKGAIAHATCFGSNAKYQNGGIAVTRF